VKKNLMLWMVFAILGVTAAWAVTYNLQILGTQTATQNTIPVQTQQVPIVLTAIAVSSAPATWYNNALTRSEQVYVTGITPGPTPQQGILLTPAMMIVTRGYNSTTAFSHVGPSYMNLQNGFTLTPTFTLTITPTPTNSPTNTPTNSPTVTPTLTFTPTIAATHEQSQNNAFTDLATRVAQLYSFFPTSTPAPVAMRTPTAP
jgi:hypothetical protein